MFFPKGKDAMPVVYRRFEVAFQQTINWVASSKPVSFEALFVNNCIMTALGDKDNILMYNKAFEIIRLKELQFLYPHLKSQ